MTTVLAAGRFGTLLAGALLVAACGRPPESEPAGSRPPGGRVVPTQSLTHSRPAAPPRPLSAACPGLSGSLAALVTAADPAAEAARTGLAGADGRAPVAIQLAAEDGDHVELALRFGLELQRRSGGWVDARAPLAALCDLARDPRVRRVVTPGERDAAG